MKYRDWSDFVVHCSGISDIMSKPKVYDLNAKEKKLYSELFHKDQLSEEEEKEFKRLTRKMERFNDPELSITAIKYLMKRYAWDKYNKKIAPTGHPRSYTAKGNELEDEAIKILSEMDKLEYSKVTEIKRNDYLLGCCDVFCKSKNKIIDVKTVWSINTFLPMLQVPLDKKYWYQMQGYLEVYNADYGEVCFVLLNTPPHLVERERAKYTEKYVFGEINRDRYDEEMEKFDLAFSYDRIPMKRRVIRFTIERYPEILPSIYKRVEKCRKWLNEFEKLHTLSKNIIVQPERYAKPKEDYLESDTADLRASDTE